MDTAMFPDVVELNIGGKLMTTLLSTLTKDPESKLAAMFSGRHMISKDKDGRFFIDCDGNVFENILNFLRFGTLPPKENVLEMYDVAVFLNLQTLVSSLECYRAVQYRRGIEEMKRCLNMQEYDYLKKDALEQIYKCCARPEDDIIVAFMFDDGNVCRTDCQGPTIGKSAGIKFKHSIVSTYNTRHDNKTKTAIVNCIAHDIHELGFGIYVYTNKPANLRCEKCKGFKTCSKTALLVAYKIIETVIPRESNMHDYV